MSMRRLSEPKFFAPVFHGVLFAITWLTIWASSQPWLDGPGRFSFFLLWIVDLPISAFAFGFMFASDRNFWPALAAWGIMGTLWWYFLGVWIEASIHLFRRKRR